MLRQDRYIFRERVGGALVLDFINTRDAWLSEAHRREFLPDYGALVAWSLEAGELDARVAAMLRRVDPVVAARVHRRALELRDGLFRLFAALAADAAPPVDAVNAAWRALETRRQLDPDTLEETWTDAPDRPLAPILESAARLLRDGPLDRLRVCPGPDGWCGALFIDRTKNRSRRWCSMAVCGNPAKMRARAARRRAAGR